MSRWLPMGVAFATASHIRLAGSHRSGSVPARPCPERREISAATSAEGRTVTSSRTQRSAGCTVCSTVRVNGSASEGSTATSTSVVPVQPARGSAVGVGPVTAPTTGIATISASRAAPSSTQRVRIPRAGVDGSGSMGAQHVGLAAAPTRRRGGSPIVDARAVPRACSPPPRTAACPSPRALSMPTPFPPGLFPRSADCA